MLGTYVRNEYKHQAIESNILHRMHNNFVYSMYNIYFVIRFCLRGLLRNQKSLNKHKYDARISRFRLTWWVMCDGDRSVRTGC